MASPIPLAIPDDFAAFALNKGWRAIAERYGVSRETITKWRRETALSKGALPAWSPEDDGYLHANYRTLPVADIAAHLNRSVHGVKARARKLGIQSPNRTVFIRRETQTRMMSGHSGEAAYLQRYGAIYRCHKDGTAAPIGAYWYWAGQVLTHDEIEAKARAHRERRELLAA